MMATMVPLQGKPTKCTFVSIRSSSADDTWNPAGPSGEWPWGNGRTEPESLKVRDWKTDKFVGCFTSYSFLFLFRLRKVTRR